MRQIPENVDDYNEPRFSNGSMSSLFPILPNNDSLRKSELHQQPLRLGVLKLDGSSFEIEVRKSGTIWELKKAVEAAFRHLPKEGAGKVSWEHVWGQFCLCHEGQKLVTDSDHISFFGIKDVDQLQFVHHASTAYNLVKFQSEREDPNPENEPTVSGDLKQKCENRGHRIEIPEEDQDDKDDDVFSRCKYRLGSLLRFWFPYDKLPNSGAETEDKRSSPSRSSLTVSFNNCPHLTSNQHKTNFQGELTVHDF